MSSFASVFQARLLNERGIAKTVEITDYFKEMLTKLEEACPQGRELAIVRTKLEEAWMFARRAISMDSHNWASELPQFSEDSPALKKILEQQR